MKLLENFKNSIRNFVIKNQLKSKRNKVEFHNLETAKSIHVFFDARTDEDYQPVKAFLSELKEMGKKIKAVGYTENEEQKAKFLFFKEVTFISSKDTNWFSKPGKELNKELEAYPADIFMNFAPEDCFAGRYLSAVSNAKFKVSGIKGDLVADFVVETAENKDTKYLIEQTKHFLNTIKKA
ncbi:MAG: hypothetical protein U9N85_06365 [Bacteroidota bacterium]|nr:hypothetical protein [Bacteroidota bacterium]